VEEAAPQKPMPQEEKKPATEKTPAESAAKKGGDNQEDKTVRLAVELNNWKFLVPIPETSTIAFLMVLHIKRKKKKKLLVDFSLTNHKTRKKFQRPKFPVVLRRSLEF
jgi:hypothetical protein